MTEAVTVTILPTACWIESDFFGGRHVVLQHEGLEPFTYASFPYDYRYTSNSMTAIAAETVARSLGAVDPIEQRQRPFPPPPTPDKVRQDIAEMQAYLEMIEAKP